MAAFMKFVIETPGISTGYWNERNSPSWALHSTQRRLARTVRTHDGMRFTIVDHKVDAFQYLFLANLGM